MSKGNTTENEVLKVIFTNSFDPAWRTNSYLYVSLHTGDPGEAGTQSTNEATYLPYARVAVAKTSSGWYINGSQCENSSSIVFPKCTSGSDTISYVAVGTDITGSGQILYSGQLGSSLNVSNLIQPQFLSGSLVITED